MKIMPCCSTRDFGMPLDREGRGMVQGVRRFTDPGEKYLQQADAAGDTRATVRGISRNAGHVHQEFCALLASHEALDSAYVRIKWDLPNMTGSVSS